ncbi:MAG TPA: zinc-binding alcohol dehydrogenase family protein [Paenibacillus sp.]|uniref:zinc-binding alcohol dehydrogenase family protein n=1 Tax=Paenibacillus sp. TaxID=58172 RepID=UPI002C8011B2|nr:zinc-binding alcohol dehydrogenase family protein [Paenibacillus sp.]HUC94239.1 zinc-binding alcohol dehydrogenase family protein [Paenibacillus sp.]
MKGIVCEQIGQLKLVEMDPPSLAEGEAIIRIKRVGICGTDLHAYKGNQPFFTYPRVLGHELAGIIEAIGVNARGLNKGDQVCVIPYLHCGRCIACRNGKTNCCTGMKVIGVHTDGGLREMLAVPVTHLIKTEGLTLDETAVLEPLSIGAHAVRRAEIRRDETALVIGAGPIGLGVMAFAKYNGARVIAMDINDERLDFCRQWAKVDYTVNALQEPGQRLAALTDGDYPTVVFDATGNARSMTESFHYVAHGGKLIYVGLVKADIAFHDPEFHKREMTLLGSRNATPDDFNQVLEAVRDGQIDVGSFITHRAALDEMIGHFDSWLKPESRVIKAMVEI